MKSRGYWFLGLAFILPVVVLLVVLSSLQLASASVDEEAYTLTVHIVSEAGSGDVIKTPDQMTYTPGTVVTLTAIPDPSSEFIGWSGDLLTTTHSATITMNSDKVVTATFIGSP